MNSVVVIKVSPKVSPVQFTIIIIGVELICDFNVQLWVKETKDVVSAVLRSMHEHDNDEAEINLSKHAYDSPELLHWVEVRVVRWIEV